MPAALSIRRFNAAYLLGAHRVPGEAEFVPAPGGTREDDGTWIPDNVEK
jgi:carotenoid cleavage dioxygenase-like enzyme